MLPFQLNSYTHTHTHAYTTCARIHCINLTDKTNLRVKVVARDSTQSDIIPKGERKRKRDKFIC